MIAFPKFQLLKALAIIGGLICLFFALSPRFVDEIAWSFFGENAGTASVFNPLGHYQIGFPLLILVVLMVLVGVSVLSMVHSLVTSETAESWSIPVIKDYDMPAMLDRAAVVGYLQKDCAHGGKIRATSQDYKDAQEFIDSGIARRARRFV